MFQNMGCGTTQEFIKCPSEMVEMMNFMPVYFTIVKTEGLFYSVLLAKDTCSA